MNKTITTTDLHLHLSEVLKDAMNGEPTIITYHGVSVAAIVPLGQGHAYSITEELLRAQREQQAKRKKK